MKRLTVMDLDSMIYLIAYNNRDSGLHSVVKQNTTEYVNDIIESTKAEAYAGFYQKIGHKGYRKEFFPGYKKNRPEKPDYIVEFMPTIIEAFEEFPGITGLGVIESDDALSIFANKYSEHYEMTYARIDKDLACLPGNHYNYKSGVSSVVSTQEAAYFAKCQVLQGDSVDGIPGVPGIGKVKAKQFVDAFPTMIQAYKEASKMKKVDTWIRNFYRDYHCINLLDNIEDLKQFTDREEVDIFNIDEMEYDSDAVSLDSLEEETDW